MLALHGTDGSAEWIEDGDFPPIPYMPADPLPPGTPALTVEQGFWGIYHSLMLADIHGVLIGPLVGNVPASLTADDTVVVAGHSLGAALATYLTLDLVRGPLGKQRVSYRRPEGLTGMRAGLASRLRAKSTRYQRLG